MTRRKVAPGQAIPPLVVQATKAQLASTRAVDIIGAHTALRDAFEERAAERVSTANAAEGDEREANLDIAAELLTMARLA